ncbi:MAG: acyl carrier protein [Acidobacteria bacterium]|jgi:acyl carrier protein|nr:MAG: acyl carrier protein [Acidobacteriota bacterium]
MDHMAEIRDFLKKLLSSRGDRQPFTDTSSFFLSGRLGSVDAVELVVFLEEQFEIDFSETGFDQSQIDSIEAITSLLQSEKVG